MKCRIRYALWQGGQWEQGHEVDLCDLVLHILIVTLLNAIKISRQWEILSHDPGIMQGARAAW